MTTPIGGGPKNELLPPEKPVQPENQKTKTLNSESQGVWHSLLSKIKSLFRKSSVDESSNVQKPNEFKNELEKRLKPLNNNNSSPIMQKTEQVATQSLNLPKNPSFFASLKENLSSLGSSIKEKLGSSNTTEISSLENDKSIDSLKENAMSRIPILVKALQNSSADTTEGIFRLSIVQNTDIAINRLIDEKKEIPKNTDIHVLANALKKSLHDTDFPDDFKQVILLEAGKEQQNLKVVKTAIENLPSNQKTTLQELLSFLNGIADHQDTNKMDTNNLSRMFGPNLFPSKGKKLEEINKEIVLGNRAFWLLLEASRPGQEE